MGKPWKRTLTIIAFILILFGAIWFLQGINVLPGSFMTGQMQWAVIGAMMIAAGTVLFFVANKRQS